MPYKDLKDPRRIAAQKRYYLENKKDYAVRSKKNKALIKQWFNEYKESCECKVCGEKEPCVLDFHHKNKRTKLFGLAIGVSCGYAIDKLLAEIAKCICLCSNCHRKVHAGLITI